MSKIITLVIWCIVTIALILVSSLLAYQFGSDYSYWWRVIWVELIFSLMVLSSYFFMKKSLTCHSSTVSSVVFASKCYGIGMISIYLCIRSYFFVSSTAPIAHLIVQVILMAGLALIFVGVKSIDLVTEKTIAKEVANQQELD